MIGLEPITCWLQISCSANWATSAYITNILYSVTPTGIEPVLPPWKGDVLTAWPRSRSIIRINKNYDLPDKKTPRVGLEPTTARLTAACSTNWAIEEYEIYNKTTYLIRHLYHMHCMWIPSKLHTDFRFSSKVVISIPLRSISMICSANLKPYKESVP